MSEEMDPAKDPTPEDKTGLRILWLLCGFVPGLAGISLMSMKSPPQGFLGFALFLNLICSLAAGIGVLSGMKDQMSRAMLGLFLSAGFFLLNIVIVVFVGCSQFGSPAP